MKSMIGDRIMFWTRLAVVGGMLAAAVGLRSAAALDVRLVGDKVSFKAANTPLREVLEGFARAGVRVRMDPTLQATVDGAASHEPVETVVRKLLDPFGYVLIWDVMDGPLGRFPQLAEIQVFPVGRPEKATWTYTPPENLDVAMGPDGRGPKFVPNEILIGFRQGTRRDEFERLIREIGGSVIGCAKDIGVYRVRLPDGANVLDAVAQLSRHPLISHVEPNYVMDLVGPEQTAPAKQDRGGITLPGERAQARVAILDSGLLGLKELEGLLAASWDALDPARPLNDPVGHGTQMALIAGGVVEPFGAVGGNDARSVPLIAIRAFDANGRTSSFALMRAIEYAIEQGARVMNMSWGSEVNSEFVRAAVDKALKAGVVVVAAAGNEPKGVPVYPAAYEGVVAVSALDGDGKLWSRSNTGPFVMFSAPGTANMSVGYGGAPGTYAGTSIASAYVARALALYFDRNPKAGAMRSRR